MYLRNLLLTKNVPGTLLPDRHLLRKLNILIPLQDSRSCHVVFAYLKGAQVHTERVVLQNNLEQPVLKVRRPGFGLLKQIQRKSKDSCHLGSKTATVPSLVLDERSWVCFSAIPLMQFTGH